MANSGVNVGFAKCFILFMAIVILVEGCLYFGLAIWGLTQENCSGQDMNFTSNPFRAIVDLIYFIREDCGDLSFSGVTPGSGPIKVDIDWAHSHQVTHRTFIFLIVYAVVSGLWVVSSLPVLATVCGPVTKLVSALCFWPWFLLVLAGSALDAVATGYHIHDIVHTTTANETFAYIGISTPPEGIVDTLQYYVTPAVIMTCVSSRVVLIWLLNIFGASFCLSLSRVLGEQRKHNKHQQKQQNPSQASGVVTITSDPARSTQPTTYATDQNQNQNQNQPMDYRSQQNRPGPLIIPPIESQSQQRQSPYPSNTTPFSPKAPALTPDVVIMENVRPQSANPMQSDVVVTDITYRKTDSHPDRLDYPPKTPQSPFGTTASVPVAELATGSALNNRYASMDSSHSPNVNQSPQRVNEELRSQLPWSYTSMTTKPQPPRKPQSQVYPDIPAPDYNVQSRRPQTQSGPSGVMNDIDKQQAYSRW